MNKFKYFIVKNKMMIIIISIILICAIAISIGVYAQVTNRRVINTRPKEETNDLEELEVNFDDIFTNNINVQDTANKDIDYNEIVYLAYDIANSEAGYSINAKIPFFKIENESTKSINSDIYDTFAKTIIDIVKNSNTHTTFNLDYVVYVNNDILSLVLSCKYKNGSNPQRRIIQTYNYDLKKNKILDINDIIEYKNLNKDEMQNAILEKIKEENVQSKTISEQGYNVYVRNEKDKLYKIENTPNFFLGENNKLYLIYAYGNNKYTSEIDLVIF